VEYGGRVDRWAALVVPVLRQMGVEEVMRRTGRGRSAAFQAVAGRAHAGTYLQAAAGYVRA
jgi:hypothetical protein